MLNIFEDCQRAAFQVSAFTSSGRRLFSILTSPCCFAFFPLYMHVLCMNVYMCINIMCVFAHVYVIYAFMCTFLWYMHMYTHVCGMCIYVVYMHVCANVCICLCVCTCVCCVCVHVYVLSSACYGISR